MNDYVEVSIKEFDTLKLTCVYTENDNSPVSLDRLLVSADLRALTGTLIMALDTDVINPTEGTFVLTKSEGILRKGTYLIDILFEVVDTGTRLASQTFKLNVEKGITTPRT